MRIPSVSPPQKMQERPPPSTDLTMTSHSVSSETSEPFRCPSSCRPVLATPQCSSVSPTSSPGFWSPQAPCLLALPSDSLLVWLQAHPTIWALPLPRMAPPFCPWSSVPPPGPPPRLWWERQLQPQPWLPAQPVPHGPPVGWRKELNQLGSCPASNSSGAD